MLRHSFRAMGTDVELLLEADDDEGAFGEVESEFARLESLLSRFRPDSELSRLNAAGALDAGDDLLAVTRLALEARERTGNRFDPTVHDALVAAGYDRSYDELDPSAPPGRPRACGGRVELHGRRIVLEPGFRLDLGGIAKGYAVDRSRVLLERSGPCLVNAGGDLAASPGRLWPVGVETAGGTITLGIESGALATSGRDRRLIGGDGHHLIDPATGAPARSELLRVTVAAPTAVEAEVLAKALFLGAAVDAPALLVTADGATILTGGLR